ncbi:MAG TPA: transporter substrate-binding domain-containing protein [Cellvibrio sp.]|nr:transporter substrate-binding domain-containing protein [Cellvibrio sp.]
MPKLAKKFHQYLVALLLALLALTSTAAPADKLSFITIDVAPWASVNEAGEMEGAFIELVNEIAQRINRKIDITITPFARVDRELETGSHDCTILVPRPDTLVVKGDVISYHPMGVIPRKGTEITVYEDIQALRLSVIRGATMTPRFDEDTKIYKEYDTDYLIGLRKIARGRLDGIVGAIPTLLYLAEQEGVADQLGEPFPLTEIPLLFQCSKNSPNLDIMPQVNAAIAAMKAEGVVKQIQSRYYF